MKPTPAALVPLLLVAALTVGGTAPAQAEHTQAQGAPVPDAPLDIALLAPLALPPVPATRQLIAELPQVRAARAGVAVAQARGQRLQAGTYEWTLKAGTQQRRENNGPQYTEADFALERGIRWGGKAQADRDLGEAGATVGELAYADAWHEAVRSLVQAWYDWQRARSASWVLEQQAALAQEQLEIATRRVQAGDAPRIDQLMTQAELDRALASQQQARGHEQVLLQDLKKRFPGIDTSGELEMSSVPPNSVLLPADSQVWISRIVEDNHEVELSAAEARVARLYSERARLDSRPDPLMGIRAANERGGLENIVGVYVTIPLPGAYRDADQRAALALAEAADQRLVQTRQRVEAAAQRAVLQADHNTTVWQRLSAVQQSMASVARLSTKAYSLGEVSLADALRARRATLESTQAADAAHWDALEAVSRVLVDAHQLWAADEHKP